MTFDPKRPNNDMPKLPFEVNYLDPEILIQLWKTNVQLALLNEQAKRIPNQQVLLDFLSVKEWVQSNEIENIHTTVAEVFIAELEKDAWERRAADKETIHYKEAINFGFSRIKTRWFLATNDYIQINNILLKNDAGIVTSPDKAIKTSRWEVRYTPPQWIALISDFLKNLEDNYNVFDEVREIDPLLKLPLLHYQFEAIHPFGDGNGRTGRILAVLYLVLHKKLDLPILFLSDFISRYKGDYYSFLGKIDHRDYSEVKEFILWMLAGIEMQALNTRMSIYRIQILMSETTKKIKETPGLAKMYSRDFIDFLFVRPYYSIEWLENALGIHRNTASTYLNGLKSAWMLRSMKIGKSKIFFFKDYLDTLNDIEGGTEN